MDISPNLHVLRTERNIYIYIYNSQNNGTGGNDGFECVTLTSVVNLTCVATLTSVVNIMLQRRDAENVTSSPNQWNIYIHSILPGVQSCTKAIPLLA